MVDILNKQLFKWVIGTAAAIMLAGVLLTILGLPGFINSVAVSILVGSLLVWWWTHLEE